MDDNEPGLLEMILSDGAEALANPDYRLVWLDGLHMDLVNYVVDGILCS